MSGWIKLHRKTLNSPIFDNPHLLKMWMWCLLKATHKEHNQMVGLEEIKLEEGQFITGRHKGSTELNINPSTWYKHLQQLERMSMIAVKSNNKMTTVTVLNWGLYQSKEIESNSEITTKEQQNNTNKNVKNDKNDIKHLVETSPKFNEDTIEYQLAELLFKKMLLNDDKAKTPNLYKWAEDIDKIIRLDKRSIEDIKSVIDFATSDPFWQTNILSTGSLRKQFPKLYLKINQKVIPKKLDRTTKFHNFTGRTSEYTAKDLEAVAKRKREEYKNKRSE